MPDFNSCIAVLGAMAPILIVGLVSLWFFKPSEPEEFEKEIKLPPDLT